MDEYNFDIDEDEAESSATSSGHDRSSAAARGGAQRRGRASSFEDDIDENEDSDLSDDFDDIVRTAAAERASRAIVIAPARPGAGVNTSGASALSLEERVAARLAILEAQRAGRLGGANTPTTGSADVSAVTSASTGTALGPRLQTSSLSSVSGLVRGGTAGGRSNPGSATTSPARIRTAAFTDEEGDDGEDEDAYVDDEDIGPLRSGSGSLHTSLGGGMYGSANGSGLGSVGRRPAITSPLSPDGGDVDTSSDLSSGDFTVKSTSIAALQARKAAISSSLNSSAASGVTGAGTLSRAGSFPVPPPSLGGGGSVHVAPGVALGSVLGLAGRRGQEREEEDEEEDDMHDGRGRGPPMAAGATSSFRYTSAAAVAAARDDDEYETEESSSMLSGGGYDEESFDGGTGDVHMTAPKLQAAPSQSSAPSHVGNTSFVISPTRVGTGVEGAATAHQSTSSVLSFAEMAALFKQVATTPVVPVAHTFGPTLSHAVAGAVAEVEGPSTGLGRVSSMADVLGTAALASTPAHPLPSINVVSVPSPVSAPHGRQTVVDPNALLTALAQAVPGYGGQGGMDLLAAGRAAAASLAASIRAAAAVALSRQVRSSTAEQRERELDMMQLIQGEEGEEGKEGRVSPDATVQTRVAIMADAVSQTEPAPTLPSAPSRGMHRAPTPTQRSVSGSRAPTPVPVPTMPHHSKLAVGAGGAARRGSRASSSSSAEGGRSRIHVRPRGSVMPSQRAAWASRQAVAVGAEAFIAGGAHAIMGAVSARRAARSSSPSPAADQERLVQHRASAILSHAFAVTSEGEGEEVASHSSRSYSPPSLPHELYVPRAAGLDVLDMASDRAEARSLAQAAAAARGRGKGRSATPPPPPAPRVLLHAAGYTAAYGAQEDGAPLPAPPLSPSSLRALLHASGLGVPALLHPLAKRAAASGLLVGSTRGRPVLTLRPPHPAPVPIPGVSSTPMSREAHDVTLESQAESPAQRVGVASARSSRAGSMESGRSETPPPPPPPPPPQAAVHDPAPSAPIAAIACEGEAEQREAAHAPTHSDREAALEATVADLQGRLEEEREKGRQAAAVHGMHPPSPLPMSETLGGMRSYAFRDALDRLLVVRPTEGSGGEGVRGMGPPPSPSTAGYFADAAAAALSLSSACASEGYTAYVPLPLVHALSAEVAALERLLAATREGGAASPTPTPTPDVQAELIRLRGDLAASRARELEAGFELDRVRKERAGERRQAVEGEHTAAILRLQGELADVRVAAARDCEALKAKVAWYRENQAILDADASTIAAQAGSIKELQERLRATAGVGSSSSTADARRIKDLERALATADAALASRHPDSLANLIREARGMAGAGGGGAGAAEAATLLSELEKVKASSAASDAAHDRSLRTLRQEFERLQGGHACAEGRLRARVAALRAHLVACGQDPGGEEGEEMAAALPQPTAVTVGGGKAGGKSGPAGSSPTPSPARRLSLCSVGSRASTDKPGRQAGVKVQPGPVPVPPARRTSTTSVQGKVGPVGASPGRGKQAPGVKAPATPSLPAVGNAESPTPSPAHAALCAQVARLEAELASIKAEKAGAAPVLPPTPTITPAEAARLAADAAELAASRERSAREQSQVDLGELLAGMDPPNAWAAAARARQESLLRQVGALHASIALLEARADVREGELAAAEAEAAQGVSAAERLMRAQFEAAVAMKDAALREARGQVEMLARQVQSMHMAGVAGSGQWTGAKAIQQIQRQAPAAHVPGSSPVPAR